MPRVPIDVPRWLLVAAGVVVAAVGVVLVTRPLDSLTALSLYIGISCLVSGVGDLLARRAGDSVRSLVTGVLWCAAGVVVLLWIGRSVNLFGPVRRRLSWSCTGALGSFQLRRGATPERLLDGLFGLSEIAFGLAALFVARRDVAGGGDPVRRAQRGVRCVPRVERGVRVRGAATRGDDKRPGRRWPSVFRWVAAVLVVVVAGGDVGGRPRLRQGVPVVDRVLRRSGNGPEHARGSCFAASRTSATCPPA